MINKISIFHSICFICSTLISTSLIVILLELRRPPQQGEHVERSPHHRLFVRQQFFKYDIYFKYQQKNENLFYPLSILYYLYLSMHYWAYIIWIKGYNVCRRHKEWLCICASKTWILFSSTNWSREESWQQTKSRLKYFKIEEYIFSLLSELVKISFELQEWS